MSKREVIDLTCDSDDESVDLNEPAPKKIKFDIEDTIAYKIAVCPQTLEWFYHCGHIKGVDAYELYAERIETSDGCMNEVLQRSGSNATKWHVWRPIEWSEVVEFGMQGLDLGVRIEGGIEWLINILEMNNYKLCNELDNVGCPEHITDLFD